MRRFDKSVGVRNIQRSCAKSSGKPLNRKKQRRQPLFSAVNIFDLTDEVIYSVTILTVLPYTVMDTLVVIVDEDRTTSAKGLNLEHSIRFTLFVVS